MRKFAGTILISKQGGLLLQRRDDKPGLHDLGMLSIFAGASQKVENAKQTALRELEEETTIKLKPEELSLVGEVEYEGHHSTIFVAKNINRSDISIQEGAGVEEIAQYENLADRTDIAPISMIALNKFLGQ